METGTMYYTTFLKFIYQIKLTTASLNTTVIIPLRHANHYEESRLKYEICFYVSVKCEYCEMFLLAVKRFHFLL